MSGALWGARLAPTGACAGAQVRADIAASFQRVAVAHLEERARRAAGWAAAAHPRLRHLVVSGGVAANAAVRARLQARRQPAAPLGMRGYPNPTLSPIEQCPTRLFLSLLAQ